MADRQLLQHLFPDRPYFGGATAGIQGERVRHFFMSAAVSLAAQSSPALSILEIGSWTGSSTLTWAQALDRYCRDQGKVLCVDPWLPYFSAEQLQQDANYQLMATLSGLDITYNLFLHNTQFVPQGVKIDHMRGLSVDILPYLKESSFDLIYIDGDHAYESALFDMLMAKKLVKPGGLICGDDLEVQASECDLAFLEANKALDILPVPNLKRNCHPGGA
ncbi:MAG: class I SAM-dependent methyltransferase [Rhodospirillaceae bacterium]|nr:class I SAM-dependent methyltransferase [Rhodospirillaceae bacterium]MDD9913198.1 class I SAM-dependent methyltransferase [Rhodospirillaceae bacterium]MDD9928619.1 class I SAM-dependent methyltransferase [Rhodospirillaceae bacterium]